MTTQYEVRRTCLGYYDPESFAAAQSSFRHCPDCGDHTRPILIRGRGPDGDAVIGPPAQLFICDRCEVAFMVSYDPCQDASLEERLPEILGAIKPDPNKQKGLFR